MKSLILATVVSVASLATGAANAAEIYQIDTTHSFPSFSISHFGYSTFRGRFDKVSGTITLDRAKKAGAVDVSIDPASISTGVDKLNEHLKGADFFDVAKFPTMRYVSTDLVFDGDQLKQVNGELTLHGVTKPVALTVTAFVCKPHPMKKVAACGADATAVIKRSDFGVSTYSPNVGEEVTLNLQVEAQAAK